MIEFDDDVADDANVSNLDNGTGYKYGGSYVASGHIAAILAKRHRVLAKVTKKPTTRSVNMANVDTTVNNLDGEMTYYPLDDTDSNKYADGTAAALDGSEGDWMMYEPFFWSKGVNDYLNGNITPATAATAVTTCLKFRRRPSSPWTILKVRAAAIFPGVRS